MTPEGKEKKALTLDLRKPARNIVTNLQADKLWDQIHAKDVPQELVAYVRYRLIEDRVDPEQVCRSLGLESTRGVEWKKIMSALNLGYRVNAAALGVRVIEDLQEMAQGLHGLAMDAINNGTPAIGNDGRLITDDNGNYVKIKGPTKEIASAVDAVGKAYERVAKIGKDLGLFRDPNNSKGGSQGVTIVVQSSVQLATAEQIRAKHEAVKETKQALEAQFRANPEQQS